MKKITLTLFALLSIALISTISAQSFQVFYKNSTINISGQSITVHIAIDTDYYQTVACDTISVKNISGNSILTRCKRTTISAVAGSENSFCWGSGCYGVSTSTSPTLQSPTIAPSAFENSFVGDYKPHLSTGITTVNYLFYDNSNTSDAASVTIIYDLTATGIDLFQKAGGTISAAYPNPASDFVSIKYDVNEFSQKGKIIFYNMLGKAVKDVLLNEKQGVSKINITDLNEGIYFYTLVVDNKTITTKKLVISSN